MNKRIPLSRLLSLSSLPPRSNSSTLPSWALRPWTKGLATNALPLLVAGVFGTGACHLYTDADHEAPPEPNVAEYKVVKDLLPGNVQDVDILFVVDNSGSMLEEQASIAAWADDSLFGVLGMPDGTPLDLHVAVVSTDLGAGPYAIQGCEATGDDGQFQDGAVNGCAAVPGGFLSDIDDLQGGRLTNYSGTLGEAFACLAQVGTGGCGFEQPLEAMKRALDGSNPSNVGFLREDALLAVVIVSDEDDCSVVDTSLFDTNPSMDSATSILGSLSSFRCFDFGVQCAGDDPRTPGAKSDCVERANSSYLASIESYVNFLEGLKSNASMVYVAGIFGEAGTVSVSLADGNPSLDPACVSSGGQASPGVRLQGFLDGFPDRNRFASVCSPNMSGPLGNAAAGINATIGRDLCIEGTLRDVDDSSPGLQVDCRATAIDNSGRGESAITLRECSTLGEGACYQVIAAPEFCTTTQTALALDLSRAGAFSEGHHIELRCQVPQ